MEKLGELGLYVLVSCLHAGLTSDDYENRQLAQAITYQCSVAGFTQPLSELRKRQGDIHFHYLLNHINDNLSQYKNLPTQFRQIDTLNTPPIPDLLAHYVDRFKALTNHIDMSGQWGSYYEDEIKIINDGLILQYMEELIKKDVSPLIIKKHVEKQGKSKEK